MSTIVQKVVFLMMIKKYLFLYVIFHAKFRTFTCRKELVTSFYTAHDMILYILYIRLLFILTVCTCMC